MEENPIRDFWGTHKKTYGQSYTGSGRVAFNGFALKGLAYVLLHLMGLIGAAIAWALSTSMTSLGMGAYLLRERRMRRHTSVR